MKKHPLKQFLTTFCLLILVGVLTSCSSNQKSAKTKDIGLTGKISLTEENKVKHLMENKPEVSCWFPKDLLNWSFDKDKDAKFNVSTVPLQKRLAKDKMPKVNKTQNEKMKVVAISVLSDSTLGTVPRGYNTFDANTFSYWQYIDKLVYWGGSASEGIIVPPSADTIDAAHLNGVPVLGTIYFPETIHGGKIEWLDEFLKKDKKGKFPMVDKLYEVADAYGFDGWFINQETDTKVPRLDEEEDGDEIASDAEIKEKKLNQKRATLMEEFIKAYKEKGEGEQEIMWYDSMNSKGEMSWQNALTKENKDYLVDGKLKPIANDMFLNFGWNTKKLAKKDLLKKSQKNAENWNIDPYNLYAGIDLEEKGLETPVRWNLFANKENIPYTSLGLHVPDWTHFSSDNSDDNLEKENAMWVNSKGDPSKSVPVKDTSWPGISTYQVEQTAITSLPFMTNFNLGKGYNYFINGQKVSEKDWYNRSMQDIMPTYRYMFNHEKGNNLQSSIDYADAYQGGNSLRFRGTMEKGAASSVKLYQTQLKVVKDIAVTTVAKASEKTKLNLMLEFEDGKKETVKGNTSLGKEWTEVSYNLSKYEDKKIKSIGYEIISDKTAENNYEISFGELALRPKMEDKKVKVRALTIEDAVFDEEEANFAGVRMFWEEDNSPEIDHYEVYRINKNKSYSFMGATPANTLYLNGLERNDRTNKTNFVVLAVNKLGNRGEPSEVATLKWPDNSFPKASFKISQTLIAPGGEVTFKNTSSENTEGVRWEFEGGNIKESTENNPKVKYTKEGTYNVSLTAVNKVGASPILVKDVIVVSKDVKGKLSVLSKNAKISASSYVNKTEAPKFVNDGKLDTKWSASGKLPHIITFDLEELKTISAVKMSHAHAGGESVDLNTRGYTIELSNDGVKWRKVAQVTSNEASETTDTFAPSQGRFVRVVIDNPTQKGDSTARIYEIQVLGIENERE